MEVSVKDTGWSNAAEEMGKKHHALDNPNKFNIPGLRPVWAPQYVMQASPLSKLFYPEWQEKCLENPELLVANIAFEVRVPRASGGVVLEHNKPRAVSTLLPRTHTRQVDHDEITPLVEWLTGGPTGERSEDTDIYGIVALEVDMDISSEILAVVEEQNAAQKIQEIQSEMLKRLKAGVIIARERADNKVKRAMKATYNNLIGQWEKMKADGLGTYAPSIAEALSAHILRSEVEKSNALKQAALDKLMGAMKSPII